MIKKHVRKRPNDAVRCVTVLAAAVLMAVNIKILVNPGGLFPGGVTGLTILLQTVFRQYFGVNLSYTLLNVILNAVPVYIGLRFIGKKFTLFSVLMIIVSSFMVDLIPPLIVTNDTLLISVFGGILNGTAISMCLRVDATSGGTDFISIYLSQKRGMDSFNLILGFNVVVLVIAGLLFGWDKALYSILFQFVSTQTLHLLYRTYQQITLFVVTDMPKEISEAIYEISRHGATIMEAVGSYSEDKRAVVYSVVDAENARNIERIIHDIDKKAFINCIMTKEIRGNFFYSVKD